MINFGDGPPPPELIPMFERLREMQRNPIKTYSKEYPDFHMGPLIGSELMHLKMADEISETEERAFVIANSSDEAVAQDKYKIAEKMCFHAIHIDARCIDAYRGLLNVLYNQIKEDYLTLFCAVRELLCFARKFYKKEFQERPGSFYGLSRTRPYMRILMLFGDVASMGHHVELATRCYEELLRLNYNDNTGARDPLVSLYLESIATLKYGGTNAAKRTEEQINRLFTTKLGDSPVYGDDYKDEIMYQWSKMILAYIKKDDSWKRIAKEQNQKHPILIQYVLLEKLPKLDPMVLGTGVSTCDEEGTAKHKYQFIVTAIAVIPNFHDDLSKLLRGKVAHPFAKEFVRKMHKNRELKPVQDTNNEGTNLLNKGRKELQNKKFKDVIQTMTKAKAVYNAKIRPNFRIENSDMPFAILSNRATAAMHNQNWNLARIDCRLTLLLQPDHARTYDKLPYIAEAFSAPAAKKEFLKLIEETKGAKTIDDWKVLANRAIGMLSFTGLLGARCGFSQKEINEAIEAGPADLYTPVNYPIDLYPILPWNKPEDLELNVN